MIEQEQTTPTITYHRVTLGPLCREGDATIELTLPQRDDSQKSWLLRVPAGLPGEDVTIAVEAPRERPAGRKRRYWKDRPPRVWITEIHQASPLRVQAPCPVFGVCGGCQIQHLPYEEQLRWKRDIVANLLQEIGGFTEPPILPPVGCDHPWNYRNQMRFSVNREGELGLTARNSRRVLPLQGCPIAHPTINQALALYSKRESPRPQVIFRSGTKTSQLLVQPAPDEEMSKQLHDLGLEVRTETFEEELAGERFRIKPSSFFQTNTLQAEKMMQMVLSGLFTGNTLQGSDLTVIDAYCGVGTFALLLARHVGKVIAIEESASAVKDASWNVRTASNVEVKQGKVEHILPEISTKVDALVIDPPRAGCQPIIIQALREHPVKRIVYVSCSPETLARDLRLLCEDGVYRLRSVQPLDMFPQTAHIENVSVLEYAQ